jgi:hypothetical protein
MTKISPYLLADPSPCLRRMILIELLGKDSNENEVLELENLRENDPLVRYLVDKQNSDGSWDSSALGSRWGRGNRVLATSAALKRLGYLGFTCDFQPVQNGSEYLFSRQQPDGSWPLFYDETDLDEGASKKAIYSMVPLQTALPLQSLAACGLASEPGSELAYEWLLTKRLDDGAWPTGIASGVFGYVGGYRRLAHSRWGCRSNTTGALSCLALHPERRTSEAARKAMDLILGCETQEEDNLGFDVARTVGAEELRGFLTFFARIDPGQILDLSWRVGMSSQDERLSAYIHFVEGLRGQDGLWYYQNYPQVSRWVSYDLTRSLLHLNAEGWIGIEPRTPFQTYPRRIRRF